MTLTVNCHSPHNEGDLTHWAFYDGPGCDLDRAVHTLVLHSLYSHQPADKPEYVASSDNYREATVVTNTFGRIAINLKGFKPSGSR